MPAVKTVKVRVVDVVPETKEIVVEVPVVVEKPKVVKVITLAADCVTAPGVEKRLRLAETPNTVTVPLCPSVPPPPPLPPACGPVPVCPGK